MNDEGLTAGIIGIAVSIAALAVMLLILAGVSQHRDDALGHRLDAIEFELSCPPEHRYVDEDGEVFCLEEAAR